MQRGWIQMDSSENSVELKRMCTQSAAAASDSSRRFCSVTAVVCRQFSHMTWVLGVGGLCPSSQCLLFLGKMAAIALLLHMTHMDWCEQENIGSMVMQCTSVTQSTAARPYVAHRRDSECPSDAFIETKFVVFIRLNDYLISSHPSRASAIQ